MDSQDKLAVIFDTNAYRKLTYEKSIIEAKEIIEKLRFDEKKNNVKAFAYPFVMLELANHLSDEADKSFENCLSAIVALTNHNKSYDVEVQSINILADSESQLCKILHNTTPESHSETIEKVAKIFRYITDNPDEESIKRIKGDLAEISYKVGEIEKQFINDIQEYVVKGFNPNSKDWNPLKNDPALRKNVLEYLDSEDALFRAARMHVVNTYTLLNKRLDDNVDYLSKIVLDKFKAPLYFYNEIIKRIVMSGCNLTKKKRGNWVWDIEISFVIGFEHQVENKRLRLVTGDGMIHEAASQANSGSLVYKLEDYLEALEKRTLN